MHFCGDTLVETAVFYKVKGCGMEMQNPSSNECSILKNNCCRDKTTVIEGQDELQLAVNKLSFEQEEFITSFIRSYFIPFEGILQENITYKEYRPPLVVRQIYKLDETYLI